MSAQDTTRQPMDSADRAGNSDALENLARIGLLAYGVVHLLIAWAALQLAWGTSQGSADQSGALQTLAEQPFGRPLLWIVALGLAALAVWQAAEVLRWRSGWSASGKTRTEALKKSGKAVVKAAIYLSLAVLALRVATGGGGSSSQSEQKQTAGVFGWPGGRFLVGALALALLALGAYHVYKGVTKSFLKELDLAQASAQTRRLVTRLGQAGFPAKGVAFAVVGGLLGYAALTFDPAKAEGLDGALHAILRAPFGWVLLTLVAVGIGAFGAYCFVRARYPERT